MRDEILDLIFAGESDTLELKSVVRDPHLLARIIGAFANSKGGKIIVGVKEPPEVVGVDVDLLKRTYNAAISRLAPLVPTSLSFVKTEGKNVGVIEVPASHDIVLVEGGTFVRTGSMIQPMAWTQMRDRLPAQPNPATIETLARTLEKQSKHIEEMHEQLNASNSWQARWTERGIGFIFGMLASVIASAIWWVMTKNSSTFH